MFALVHQPPTDPFELYTKALSLGIATCMTAKLHRNMYRKSHNAVNVSTPWKKAPCHGTFCRMYPVTFPSISTATVFLSWEFPRFAMRARVLPVAASHIPEVSMCAKCLLVPNDLPRRSRLFQAFPQGSHKNLTPWKFHSQNILTSKISVFWVYTCTCIFSLMC